MKQITSAQNPFIKSLVQLHEKSRNRRQSGKFLLEGLRELSLAITGGYDVETVLFDPSLVNITQISELASSAELVEISRDVYQKLAYRDTTEGVIGVASSKPHSLSDLKIGENPLILVAESPEKPGNIGALLRTADAANLDAVIIADPRTDLYNPNIIRSSVGCLFTVPTATGTSEEIIDFLRNKGIRIFSATLQDSELYSETDFTQPSAIVVGTESTGLTDIWRKASDKNIIIPMQGAIDSMNVSVAAAVLIFEAKRQRGFEDLKIGEFGN